MQLHNGRLEDYDLMRCAFNCCYNIASIELSCDSTSIFRIMLLRFVVIELGLGTSSSTKLNKRIHVETCFFRVLSTSPSHLAVVVECCCWAKHTQRWK